MAGAVREFDWEAEIKRVTEENTRITQAVGEATREQPLSAVNVIKKVKESEKKKNK